MKTHIVVVGDPPANNDNDYDHGPAPRFVFEGTREWTEAVDQDTIDPNMRNWQRQVRAWRCGEKEIEHVVAQLTKWHSDLEVHVYELKTVYYRAPGTVESKAVTKDGVLPF